MIIAQNQSSINQTFRIETSCQVIGIQHGGSLPGFSILSSTELEIIWSTKSGTKTIVPRTPLSVLLSYNALNEGIQLYNAGLFGTSMFYFYLSYDGSFPLYDGDYLALTFFNAPVSSFNDYNIYAIETHKIAKTYVYVEPFYLNPSITKSLEVSRSNALVFDYVSLSKLQVNYPQRTINYLPIEVAFIQLELLRVTNIGTNFLFSGNVVSATTLYSASGINYISLMTNDALTVELTTTSSPSTVYKFSDLQIPESISVKSDKVQKAAIVENIKDEQKKS